MAQIEEVVAPIKNNQQLWLKQQRALMMLTQEIEAKNKEMCKLETEYIAMQQRKIRIGSMKHAHIHVQRKSNQFNCDS